MKMQLMLMRDGPWNIVTGVDKNPKAQEGVDKVHFWEDRNEHAVALIGLSLADSLIYHLDLKEFSKRGMGKNGKSIW